MRNPTTSKNAPGEVHTRKIRKLCTQCIHPALTRDSSSPTPTLAATICAEAHTATRIALSKWVYTQKIREKCTHCIHPALTRDSPGLQGRFLQPRSKAWENNPAAAGDHGAAASRLRHHNRSSRLTAATLQSRLYAKYRLPAPKRPTDRPDIG